MTCQPERWRKNALASPEIPPPITAALGWLRWPTATGATGSLACRVRCSPEISDNAAPTFLPPGMVNIVRPQSQDRSRRNPASGVSNRASSLACEGDANSVGRLSRTPDGATLHCYIYSLSDHSETHCGMLFLITYLAPLVHQLSRKTQRLGQSRHHEPRGQTRSHPSHATRTVAIS